MAIFDKQYLPSESEALTGREEEMVIPEAHFVSGRPLRGDFPAGCEVVYFGMGCFWGAERLFWQQDGVWTTAVGYAGGFTRNPVYEEVCSGGTGHTEVVMVVYNPKVVAFDDLLRLFWESHDPTQGMRQGNDRGTQYRSAIFTTIDQQREEALASRGQYQEALVKSGAGHITTEISPLAEFYYAEGYHQQYLAKNPDGYCGLSGTGVCLPPQLQ